MKEMLVSANGERVDTLFWGKSNPTGAGADQRAPLPLLQHLFDTAAVAELMYEHVLAPVVRGHLDALAPANDGATWFAWVAGAHDFGKASAFQALDAELSGPVVAAGLPLSRRTKVRHEQVTAWILSREAKAAGWSRSSRSWVTPLLDGHHGRFSRAPDVRSVPEGYGDADGPWTAAQRQLLDGYTRALGYADLAAVEPTSRPPRAVQLAIAGLIVTCDWIASNGAWFEGLAFDRCSIEAARDRAARAFEQVGLAARWPTSWPLPDELMQERFGRDPRPYQREVIEQVRAMTGPGLVILEAGMGEGKTEAGMAAAELLAAQHGANGIVVAMPTQATSDQIFSRLTSWADRMPFDVPLTLLHGRRSLHPQWQRLERPETDATSTVIGPYGFPEDEPSAMGALGVDPSQIAEDDPGVGTGTGIAQWWDGRYRGLGSDGLAVCTIDQPLLAATRTKFVSLRFAGLAGKVVLLDEIHAADVYMSQFLLEMLRWLGQARVPVVAMSATLPTHQRQALVDAYLSGAQSERKPTLITRAGYPQVTVAQVERAPSVTASTAWRGSHDVEVSATDVDDHGLAALLDDALGEGGCALVVRNTVARAQDTYRVLASHFGAGEVRLLHARFLADHRSSDTAAVVNMLGEGDSARPHRLIVVGTQVVEQSLDLDADLLVSDIAPVDLLLQRAGRLHRHARARRPDAVAVPRVHVTGIDLGSTGPDLDAGSRAVYGTWRLLRTAALLDPLGVTTWTLPDAIPGLVEAVYDDDAGLVPLSWSDLADVARAQDEEAERRRTSIAAQRVLAGTGDKTAPTLEDLHFLDSKVDTNDDAIAAAAVRDGDPTVEVVVVGHRDGQLFTMADGRPLGVHGERATTFADVAGSTIRLPARLRNPGDRPVDLTAAALRLGPLPAWLGLPQLQHLRVWCLDDCDVDAVQLPEVTGSYDRQLGLTLEVRHA